MSPTDDAKLVVETIGKMRQAPGPLSVLPDGYDEACLRLSTAYIELSAELAEHKRRLLEQSAVLNSVRQERDRALLVVADLLDGADEHWQKTPRGVSVMAAGRELFAERKAGGE